MNLFDALFYQNQHLQTNIHIKKLIQRYFHLFSISLVFLSRPIKYSCKCPQLVTQKNTSDMTKVQPPQIIMQFFNLSQNQLKQLYMNVSDHVIFLKNDIKAKININLGMNQLFQIVISYFINCGEIIQTDLLKIFLEIFCLKFGQTNNVKALINTISGTNLTGRLLKHQDEEDLADEWINTLQSCFIYIGMQEKSKMRTMIEMLFLDGFQSRIVDFVQVQYDRQQLFSKNIYNRLQYFYRRLNVQIAQKMVKQGKFNKNKIDSYYYFINPQNELLYRRIKRSNNNIHMIDSIIIKVYDKWIKNGADKSIKYASYQLINHLMLISEKSFNQYLTIQNNEDIQNLFNCLKNITDGKQIKGYKQLITSANIVKYIEKSNIHLNFSDTFKLKNIPDQTIIAMLDNIENRLQYIQGTKYFLILRRIADNKVFKIIETEDNKSQINQLIQECDDGQLYDVIIISQQKYSNIGYLKIRYLNYLKTQNSISIKLKNPQDLVSATLDLVHIVNISQCINLCNLYSNENEYKQQDLELLINLKRVYSQNDNYDNYSNCLLEDLFANNIEYLHIVNNYSNSNVVDNITLAQNIKHLRYLYIEQHEMISTIKLNCNTEYPTNLNVFNVATIQNNSVEYGTINGDDKSLSSIQQSLIHFLKVNE